MTENYTQLGSPEDQLTDAEGVLSQDTNKPPDSPEAEG